HVRVVQPVLGTDRDGAGVRLRSAWRDLAGAEDRRPPATHRARPDPAADAGGDRVHADGQRMAAVPGFAADGSLVCVAELPLPVTAADPDRGGRRLAVARGAGQSRGRSVRAGAGFLRLGFPRPRGRDVAEHRAAHDEHLGCRLAAVQPGLRAGRRGHHGPGGAVLHRVLIPRVPRQGACGRGISLKVVRIQAIAANASRVRFSGASSVHTTSSSMRMPPYCLNASTLSQAISFDTGLSRSSASSMSMKYSPGSIVTTMFGSSTRVMRRYGWPSGRAMLPPRSLCWKPATSCTSRPIGWPRPCGKNALLTPDSTALSALMRKKPCSRNTPAST